ncbi:MAG: hypothetical protein J0H25_15610, partial [Rhizobiales bacterium]|nr:hypothetical protein [Hyphomicrobiales bacterium]
LIFDRVLSSDFFTAAWLRHCEERSDEPIRILEIRLDCFAGPVLGQRRAQIEYHNDDQPQFVCDKPSIAPAAFPI